MIAEMIPIIASSLYAPIGTHVPVSDWKHDPERVKRAEAKRLMRATKRKLHNGQRKDT